MRATASRSPPLLYAISLSSLRDVAYILGLVAHTLDNDAGFGDGNRGSFSDPALDRLIEAATVRSDPGREAALRPARRRRGPAPSRLRDGKLRAGRGLDEVLT